MPRTRDSRPEKRARRRIDCDEDQYAEDGRQTRRETCHDYEVRDLYLIEIRDACHDRKADDRIQYDEKNRRENIGAEQCLEVLTRTEHCTEIRKHQDTVAAVRHAGHEPVASDTRHIKLSRGDQRHVGHQCIIVLNKMDKEHADDGKEHCRRHTANDIDEFAKTKGNGKTGKDGNDRRTNVDWHSILLLQCCGTAGNHDTVGKIAEKHREPVKELA